MRLVKIFCGILFGAAAGTGPCFAVAPTATTSGCEVVARNLKGGPESKAAALDLLASLTQLRSPIGMPVLTSNLATTVAINNTASAAARAQAIHDAQITDSNANTLADGLGASLAAIYRDKAFFKSDDDGKTPRKGEIGPHVSALLVTAATLAAGDSGEGKFAFADGSEPFQHGTYKLPPGGTYDVLGKTYGHEPGSPGADCHGNSRPYQTAPLDAPSGPAIHSFDGVDFFGVRMNSRVLLRGATPEDEAAGRHAEPLDQNPAYPSGHTTFGYTEALVLAMLVPERYRALAFRGSEYGDSRIVLGAHYAVDVIGGRTLATYDLAQNLAATPGYWEVKGVPFRTAMAAAAIELRTFLQEHGCPSIADCAARDPIVRGDTAGVLEAGRFQPATAAQAYAFRLNYGLTPMGPTDAAPEPVPPEAAYLLETRFPYLTPDQRREILRTTEGPSGHFLDASPLDGKPLASGGKGPEAQVGVYSRLNLFAAAGGYTSFDAQVVVNQDVASVRDPVLRPFADLARADTWSNDIAGSGGLTKRGAGTLTLSGAGTYTGPTRVEGGTLAVTGTLASPVRVASGATLAGSGRVHDVTVVPGGTLAPGAAGGGPLDISGSLDLSEGATYAARPTPTPDVSARITGRAALDGAHLQVKSEGALQPGRRYTILTAHGGVSGAFRDVSVDAPGLMPKLTYAPNAVYLTLEEKSAAR